MHVNRQPRVVVISDQPVSEKIIATHLRREEAMVVILHPSQQQDMSLTVDKLLEEAIEQLPEAPDIAFVTHSRGTKLVREMRKRHQFGKTRILIVGRMDLIDMSQAKFAGANDYVFLPLKKEELLKLYWRHCPAKSSETGV